MTKQFTDEEIEKRIDGTQKKRRELKLKLDAERSYDKMILQKLHAMRHVHHFCSYGSVTLDIVGNSVFTDEFRVFFTCCSDNDRESFRVAKKTLGKFWYENRVDRQFVMKIGKWSSEEELCQAAFAKFSYLVLSNRLDVSKSCKRFISRIF
jgi:Ser-tRNA(Ala) deacylase AlaX